jgi:hypothetical protein
VYSSWLAAVFLVIVTQVYESFDSNAYMALGVVVGVPPMVYPLLYPLGKGTHVYVCV